MFPRVKLFKQFTELSEIYSQSCKKTLSLQTNLHCYFKDKEITEDLDESEADFTSLNLRYQEHIKENELMKERQKHLIVRQKYFKEKTPNFLTWSEKEQIKYLHSSNSDEWTIEKLSNGFPALPETISAIVKSSWKKKNLNKVKNHDLSVQKNWDLFKKDQIPNLPQRLVEHLKKFQEREINTECYDLSFENKNDSPKIRGEFYKIIESYKQLKHQNVEQKSIESNELQYIKKKKETYLLTPPNKFEHKNPVQLKFSKENSKPVVDNSSQKEEYLKLESESKILIVEDKKGNYEFLKYPEKIKIPSDKLKKGCIYKFRDCYYDDDGEFLYRVPGMY